jgi:hypothetical protein
MSDTLNDIRGEIVTSLHGRRCGIDKNEFLVGPKGLRDGITAATSATTGTAFPNYGVVTIDSTTGDSYTLSDPVAGCQVRIVVISTGGVQTVTPANATIMSSASSTGGPITMTGGSQASIDLLGVSTALWVPVGRYGSSATVHVTT